MDSDPLTLVTGAGGQVGRALRSEIPAARLLDRTELDVTDRAAVRSAMDGMHVVVHLAAMTDVDECEREPGRANAINADGTAHVVGAAAERGARVIYVSTDYVFDGTKRGEYVEQDAPAPINWYGRSKRAGEEHALGNPGNLVVRTSWVFGEGRNFVRTILEAARGGGLLRVVEDQRGRPTWAQDIARSLAHLVRIEATGIVHVAGDGEPGTWADLAELALAAAGLTVPLERIDSETYRRGAERLVALRPRNSALSLRKAQAIGVPLADWRYSVRRYVEEAR
jgi:dTDP-4-dehydrorhamnose reductase